MNKSHWLSASWMVICRLTWPYNADGDERAGTELFAVYVHSTAGVGRFSPLTYHLSWHLFLFPGASVKHSFCHASLAQGPVYTLFFQRSQSGRRLSSLSVRHDSQTRLSSPPTSSETCCSRHSIAAPTWPSAGMWPYKNMSSGTLRTLRSRSPPAVTSASIR